MPNSKQTPAQQQIEAKRAEIAKKQPKEGEAQKAGRVNNIQIEGIMHDPDFSMTPNGKEMWKGRLEVSQGTNADGTWKASMVLFTTFWHNDGENDDLFAEAIGIDDKRRVVVEGKLGMRSYNDKNGNQQRAWTITAHRISEV